MSSTKREKTYKVRTALNVSTDHKYGGFHIYGRVVTIGPNAWEQRCRDDQSYAYPDIKDNTIRNCGDDLIDGLYLDNLRINSFGYAPSEGKRSLTGWDVTFEDVHTIDIRRAERMTKTLRAIEARLTRMNAKLGTASSFGQYLARVAAAIGADQFITLNDHTSGDWCYHAGDYRFMAVETGVRYVDRVADAWVNPKPAEPAQVAEVAVSA